MQTENQMKADAINEFVSTMIGAHDAGFTGGNSLTLQQLHRIAQCHIRDNYGIDMPNIVEQWGQETAELCGLNKR